ncbi:MAG: GatB/YqeY domain-containing protein [Candidatus Nomurabacteria bacterium]|nr:GatB/YqeY domain-containing protein [Candidatus Nomurabacteria bacterium]
MLQEQIKSSIKGAMIAKDSVRLETLRGMSAAFMNELVAKGKKPQDTLTDEEVIAVITRLAKQRKDSIDQFKKGGREDLVAEESAQLSILETYLPKLIDRSEIEEIVKTKKNEMGEIDPTKKGMFLASIMKDLKGKADGALVKEVVDMLF